MKESLAKIYMVLRSLYGLWPEVWVGRTSTELNFKVFQNINLSKKINYILQLAQNEVDGGLSHPRLCPAWPIRDPFPVNRATKEPPPQRTKRARRKSSGGASVDWERMCLQTGKECSSRLGRMQGSLVRINAAHHGEEVVEHRKNLGQILIHSLNAAGQNKYDRFTGYACNASAKKGVRLFCSVF